MIKEILDRIFETSEESVDREIRECKEAYEENLSREPTEKEIESWLI